MIKSLRLLIYNKKMISVKSLIVLTLLVAFAKAICIDDSFCGQHGQLSLDSDDAYRCHCVNGYIGSRCQLAVDFCQERRVLNGGTCVVNPDNSLTVTCTPDYYGDRCQNVVDKCVRDLPCLNGATCYPVPQTSYTCQCAFGFAGSNCETALPTCAEFPAQNGGTCIDTIYGAQYQCAPGFNGLVCENVANPETPPGESGEVGLNINTRKLLSLIKRR